MAGHWNRRRWLGGVGLASLTPVAALARPIDALGAADYVVRAGKLYTMDDAYPEAESFAVKGDRIVAVGTDLDVNAVVGPWTRVIDARDFTVTPGFIDAHSHPAMVNEAISVDVNVRTIGEVQTAIAAHADKMPSGQWVMAHMYDDTKFVENRPLDRSDIDAVVRSQPVMVRHRGGHTAVVNSAALALAGVTADTPDPIGGRFFRDDGRLTGKVAEHAMDVFFNVGEWPAVTREAARDGITLMSKRMAAAGLTSTTDAAGGEQGWRAYIDALDADALHFRVAFMPGGASELFEQFKALGIRSGYGNNMLRVGAVKYGADGSASERTMRMSRAFEGTNDFGILTMQQQEIDFAVDDAVANGYRIGIHANGDVTIDMVLNAYERVLASWEGENPRFRIEHCSLVNDELLRRIKATGAVPTPFYTYAHYHGEKWVYYGEERMRHMFAHRSFLDWDIPVAPASDFTPGPFEPMMALQSMVTRKDLQGRVWGENQRVSVSEAMRICTVNGAYASFEEHDKGSITPGKLADFVFLGADPHDADPDRIKEIPVVATYLGGRPTFEA